MKNSDPSVNNSSFLSDSDMASSDLGDKDCGQAGHASKEMSLLEHLAELRRRILKCLFVFIGIFLICWAFDREVASLLLDPLVKILPPGSRIVFIDLPEGFLAYLNVSLIAAIFVSSPFWFYQLWSFVSPGLKTKEKKYLFPMAMASAFLFAAGAIFAYFVIFPCCFSFFLDYASENIHPALSLRRYLGFSVNILLAFGIIFQLPISVFFLAKMHLVNPDMLSGKRAYAILAAFILGAILTPPDPVSQIFMAIPFILLYELSIVVAKLVYKKYNKGY